MNLSPELLIAVASMLTAMIAVFRSLSLGYKDKSEAALAISQGYGGLVEDYQQQLKEFKDDNAKSQERIKILEDAAKRDGKKILELELKLSQALERIAVLEGENESLRERRAV